MLEASNALEEYEQLEMLGCGGMAVVYAARHLKTKDIVAIKYLSNQFLENEQAIEGFGKEAETLKLLNHPNIVKYVDSGIFKNRYFLIMEYLQGQSFEHLPRQRVVEGRENPDERDLPLERLIDIFLGCLSALQFSHKHDVIHRDIKPENILILGDYKNGTAVPKLIDFGIADAQEEEDLDSSTVVGMQNALTLPYASPEQVQAKPTTRLSDIFSLGVVMYEKLTGHFPFNGKNQVEIFLQHMKWDIMPIRKYNKYAPKRLQDIVFKAIRKEEEDRYQDTGEFIEALENFQKSFILSKQALSISPFINQVRSATLTEHESINRKKSIYEESKYIKQVLSQHQIMNQKYKLLQNKPDVPKEKLNELKKMCRQLRNEHQKVKAQMKMCLGLLSDPIMIEKTDQVYKIPIRVYEKKGSSLTIGSIEYFMTFIDGSPIKTKEIDFTAHSRKLVPFHQKDKKVSFLNWDDSHWWFQPYEEKVFYTKILLSSTDRKKPAEGYDGIFWTRQFFNAFQRFGKTGLTLNFSFLALDGNEKQVFADHSTDIHFGAGLYE
ncbi:serine/threonine-protein kinase [Candidatus Riflebacteria bacterium]